jgi:hypothetical protein
MYAGLQYRLYMNPMVCLNRQPLLNGKYVKTKFTGDEDARLIDLVAEYGTADWAPIAFAMQTRNQRQCRERYNNYLDPALRTDPWTAEEDALLTQKYGEFGGKWNKIGKFFTKRSDNALRNRWMLLERHRHKPCADGNDILGAAMKVEEFDIFDPPRAAASPDVSDGGEPWQFDL